VRWLTLATIIGALVSPQLAADAAASRPAAPSRFAEGGGGGGGTGIGTGNATNTAGGSPAQQASITVNGVSTFQAAVCNQRMQTCNINQRLRVQW